MDLNLNTGKLTPKSVAELHYQFDNNIPQDEGTAKLTKTQELRALSVGRVIESAIPYLEDTEELSMCLQRLAGWILWGDDYASKS